MPRMQKRPYVEPVRRKCATCGKIKLVEHRSWTIPPAKTQTTYVSNTKKRKLRKDMPGVSVTNYCSIECAGDDFVNNYTERDFLR